MLRITANDCPRVLTLRLEARFEGPEVKARLAEMHEQGARLIAGDCVTMAVLGEIEAS
jgi:hypothetical protein